MRAIQLLDAHQAFEAAAATSGGGVGGAVNNAGSCAKLLLPQSTLSPHQLVEQHHRRPRRLSATKQHQLVGVDVAGDAEHQPQLVIGHGGSGYDPDDFTITPEDLLETRVKTEEEDIEDQGNPLVVDFPGEETESELVDPICSQQLTYHNSQSSLSHPITLQSRLSSGNISITKTVQSGGRAKKRPKDEESIIDKSEESDTIKTTGREGKSHHLWVKSPSLINSDQGFKRK